MTHEDKVMDITTFKPRVGSLSFHLMLATIHCINLCRHDRDAEIVSYLRTLNTKERVEVYGRLLAWVADHSTYDKFVALRRRVWSSGLTTCHVVSKEDQ